MKKSLFWCLIFVVVFMFIISCTPSGESLAGKGYYSLTNEQKQAFWDCWKSECQELFKQKDSTYRECSLNCFSKAEQATEEVWCEDSDEGTEFLVKGIVTSNIYITGKEDYCHTFSSGKTYLMEGKCVNNKYQYQQKNCGELGSEFVCNEGKCVYKDISSLAEAITAGANSDYEKVVKLVDWEMKNFFHAGGLWGWDTYEGYTNILSLPIKELFKERIVGCHQAANILVSLLNSINIPAEKIVVENHGVVYLSSLNKYVHGDYIANLVSVPAEQLIMTEEELNSYAYSQEGYKAFQKLVKYDEVLGEWVNIVHLKRKQMIQRLLKAGIAG